MLIQAISLAGAMTILAAFVLQLWGRLKADDAAYLWANTLGAGVLTVVAWIESQWGFLLMESVWTAVSLNGLVKRTRT
ncbi:MAG: hypothetical protein AABY95_07860 [Pseudomonadota bacterium]